MGGHSIEGLPNKHKVKDSGVRSLRQANQLRMIVVEVVYPAVDERVSSNRSGAGRVDAVGGRHHPLLKKERASTNVFFVYPVEQTADVWESANRCLSSLLSDSIEHVNIRAVNRCGLTAVLGTLFVELVLFLFPAVDDARCTLRQLEMTDLSE